MNPNEHIQEIHSHMLMAHITLPSLWSRQHRHMRMATVHLSWTSSRSSNCLPGKDRVFGENKVTTKNNKYLWSCKQVVGDHLRKLSWVQLNLDCIKQRASNIEWGTLVNKTLTSKLISHRAVHSYFVFVSQCQWWGIGNSGLLIQLCLGPSTFSKLWLLDIIQMKDRRVKYFGLKFIK